LPEIDLVICDEAHRTTGATFDTDDKESNFVRVHDNDFLKAAKRLYMTATRGSTRTAPRPGGKGKHRHLLHG